MLAASWMHSMKNTVLSREVLAGGRKFLSSKSGARLARYASIGAGLGATRGLFDNIIGQDRISVAGGAIQGAVYGAGFMGLTGMWKYGRAARKASIVARGAAKVNVAASMAQKRLPYIQDKILGRGRGVMRNYFGM